MSEFKLLSEAIAEWVEYPLDQLPPELQTWVENAFIASWDGLTVEQRLSVANQWDAQHDPANEETRQYWWDFFARQQKLENHITKWEATGIPTATDTATQQSELKSLEEKRLAMEKEYQAAISQEAASSRPTGESPQQRKQRLKAWYKEEGQKGPGAQKRTAKREGIKRQTLAKILKRP